MVAEHIMAGVVQPLHGRPCWSVKIGYAAMLTLEFGEPHLRIREPIASKAKLLRVRRLAARRHVQVYGQWHLWITGGDWTAVKRGRPFANRYSSSDDQLESAAIFLDGQILTGIEIDPEDGRSTFRFDLGGRLDVVCDEPDSELWDLFDPTGRVLTVHGDGMYSYDPGNTAPDERRWEGLVALPKLARRRKRDDAS